MKLTDRDIGKTLRRIARRSTQAAPAAHDPFAPREFPLAGRPQVKLK